ncbi:tyrosine-type recombinase/integrase [Lutimonas halocynthiae]|uniref:tyrosine-type recombinase/integrase n=1 Tax=Lutimonas halocynthiae TaxID=1446477 RepID=UPI0025B28736|nr:tyrosine-type recombinase/integrase [Lutimonas halocynthiae]MDN3641158.1 tyrosine-type recombinase/integrase [Lutimonas halocynthiae]
MASVTYRLRGGKTLYCRFINGRETTITLRLPFKINPLEWSQKKQQIKSVGTEYQIEINNKLIEYKTFLLNESAIAIANGQRIDIVLIKHLHNQFFNPPVPTEDYTFYQYIEKYISIKGRNKHLDSLKYWINKAENVKLLEVNYNWIQNFADSKFKDGYAESTIGKQVQLIKNVIKFAEQNNVKINSNIYDFKAPSPKSLNTYLNSQELELIFNYNCKTERLENVRRLFLVGCTTGLRVSDLMKIKNFPINDNFIEITSQKTNQPLLIPIDPRVKDYIPTLRPLSHPVFNRYIKELCELAKINKPIKGYARGKGNKRLLGVYPKFKLITSHTMRRSFASNLYGKVPTVVIMAITGHTTEKSFLTYIKKPQRDFAERLKEYYFEKEEGERRIA